MRAWFRFRCGVSPRPRGSSHVREQQPERQSVLQLPATDGGTDRSAAGWSPYKTGPGTRRVLGAPTGGGLTGQLDPCEHVSLHNAMAGWVFDAPPDTTIANYSLPPIRCDRPWQPGWPRSRHLAVSRCRLLGRQKSPSRYAQITCLRLSSCFTLGNPAFPLAPANLFERSDLRILRVFLVNQCDGGRVCADPASGRTSRSGQRGLVSPTHRHRDSRVSRSAYVTSNGSNCRRRASGHIRRGGPRRRHSQSWACVVADGQILQERPSQPVPSASHASVSDARTVPLVARTNDRVGHDPHRERTPRVPGGVDRRRGKPRIIRTGAVEVQNRGVRTGWGQASSQSWTHGCRVVGACAGPRASWATADTRSSPDGSRPNLMWLSSGAALDVSATTGRPGSRARVIGQVVTAGDGVFTFAPRRAARDESVSITALTHWTPRHPRSASGGADPGGPSFSVVAQARQSSRHDSLSGEAAWRGGARRDAGRDLRPRGCDVRGFRRDGKG